MIVRVARQARLAPSVQRVLVATDDARIEKVAKEHHIEAVLTPECDSGTDRVYRALQRLEAKADLVINVQGDEPLIDPADIEALILAYKSGSIGTLARPVSATNAVSAAEHFLDPNVVKAVTTPKGRALYFSRAPIPHVPPQQSQSVALHHVGIYAYEPAVLARFVALQPSKLERLERLEQLRALENDIPIYVSNCVSKRPTIAVDTPEDLEAVLQELKRREAHTPRDV